MSNSKLPERPSLEYLKKLAKDRLQKLRKAHPHAKLTSAQLAIAREYGFSSWPALKAKIEDRETNNVTRFLEACEKGDIETLRRLLAQEPGLVRAEKRNAQYRGWTGLHAAAQHSQLETIRLLLQHGADPNAREAGDNTYPLHWAAARKDLEIVRALLDAGGDVHGTGDVHELGVIGWAAVFREPDDNPLPVVSLLLERGAHHHIFSAISLGDLNEIRELVQQSPKSLDRRLSRFEGGQTPLHFAISRKRHDIVDLLIELSADLEAEDQNGHTALDFAIMHGDREAIRRLHAAGAKGNKAWVIAGRKPANLDAATFRASMAKMAESIHGATPMIRVPDIAQTLDWYTSIGFTEAGRNESNGLVDWGIVLFGKAQLMFMLGKPNPQDVRLWFYTNKVDRLYELFKGRLLQAAQASLSGAPDDTALFEFIADINDPFYGGREFGIRDLNGYGLYFRQG